MKIATVGELLHWSYANLAMAHSAIATKAEKYGRTQYMIRSRFCAGLNKSIMSILIFTWENAYVQKYIRYTWRAFR